jgi:hypothetical protein
VLSAMTLCQVRRAEHDDRRAKNEVVVLGTRDKVGDLSTLPDKSVARRVSRTALRVLLSKGWRGLHLFPVT